MSVIDFSQDEQKQIFSIVASVLHMGNVNFTEEEGGFAKVDQIESVRAIANVSIILQKNFFSIYVINISLFKAFGCRCRRTLCRSNKSYN